MDHTARPGISPVWRVLEPASTAVTPTGDKVPASKVSGQFGGVLVAAYFRGFDLSVRSAEPP